MTAARRILESLRPTEKPTVMELVRDAGLDVSDWARYDGTPSANPAFCYEWCFEQEGIFVFNIWLEEIEVEGEQLVLQLNMRKAALEAEGPRRNRARRFDSAVRRAYETRSLSRAVILDRPLGSTKGATVRRLDKTPWTVTDYDERSGDFVLKRGIHSPASAALPETQERARIEGQLARRLVKHRRREAKLRDAKIEKHRREHDDRLSCEVPGCGFDFEATYGALGRGYAQVHHLIPLASLDAEGEEVRLEDLAIVCANCHAMLHRHGECHELGSLLPGAT